jgi:hypothetical protein
MQETSSHRGTGIWPFILIGVGLMWLLGEVGILSSANLSVLFRLWPIILIAIGLELLVGRNNQALSTLIGVFTVVLLVALMVVGPSLGLGSSVQVQHAQYTEPKDGATSAQVNIGTALGALHVDPLSDSGNLMEADINYVGSIEYNSEGDTNRQIQLTNDNDGGMNVFGFFSLLSRHEEADWNIALDPTVPLDLTLSNGTGSSDLNLSELTLMRLNVSNGTGSINLNLPAADASYDAQVSTGTGSTDIAIPEGAALDLRLSSGTGSVNIDVPDGAAVRIEASTGTGSINLPSGWQRVAGNDNSVTGDSGTWETDGFANADSAKITIHYDGGTGSLSVQ